MINTNNLRRGNRLLLGEDVVVVLTISKTSLRIYNLSLNTYVPMWVDDKEFDPLPLSSDVVEEMDFFFDDVDCVFRHRKIIFLNIIEEQDGSWALNLGFFNGWKIRYQHELDNSLAVLGYKKDVNRKKDNV